MNLPPSSRSADLLALLLRGASLLNRAEQWAGDLPASTMSTRKLLVVDVETTGLSPQHDAIVELAACLVSDGDLREEDHFYSRVRTDVPISDSAYRVHGLTLQDIQSAPELKTVLRQFNEFAPTDSVICGHNVSFDAAFLREGYRRTSLTYAFDYHVLDIWSIACFVLGARGIKLKSYNLTTLCSVFGIERAPTHNALQDVRASVAILRHLYSAVGGEKMEVLGQFTLFR